MFIVVFFQIGVIHVFKSIHGIFIIIFFVSKRFVRVWTVGCVDLVDDELFAVIIHRRWLYVLSTGRFACKKSWNVN